MSSPAPAEEPDATDWEAQLSVAETKIDNLEVALRSARTIGMAIGILMALRKIPESEAFELLRQSSQASNRKLRDVAEDVVRSGTLE